MRKLSQIGILFAGIAAVVLTTTVPAYADAYAYSYGSRAVFKSHGEHFYLTDTTCDGDAAVMQYQLKGGPKRVFRHTGGCHTTLHVNKSFAENRIIWIWACEDSWIGSEPCASDKTVT